MTDRRTQPNDKVQRVAALIVHGGLGKNITRAVVLINDELSAIGFPAKSAGEKVSGGGYTTSDPEHNAIELARLTGQREDLRDAISQFVDHGNALDRLVRAILAERPPSAEGQQLCHDKQVGRQGVEAWGDVSCTELPLGGWQLCPRCTKRETRWRAEQGLRFRGQAPDVGEQVA